MGETMSKATERDVVWTPRLGVTLEAIRTYMSDHGMAPSLAELGNALGVSRVNVHGRIHDLAALGLIEYRGKTRGIRLVAKDTRELCITG